MNRSLLDESQLALTGLPGGSKAYFLTDYVAVKKTPLILVTREDMEAEGLIADFEAWFPLKSAHPQPPLMVYPEFDPAGRISALEQIHSNACYVVALSQAALALPTLSPAQFQVQRLMLR